MRALSFFALAAFVASTGCLLEPPGVGRAADPAHAEGPAPWGSATSNAEMEKKVTLLTDILDGKLIGTGLTERIEKDYPDMSPEERKVALQSVTALIEQLREGGFEGTKVTGPDRDMAIAQLYFTERRFIQAATLLSRILDKNPIYPGARNLLARCFFFLQNRDRTIAELEFVLSNPEQQKNKDEVLDALFLLGAAVSETPGMSRANLEKGKGAWETYLKLSADSPQRKHIEEGLQEIEAGLRGEGPLAQAMVPRDSEAGGVAPKNVMGGAKSMPTASAAPTEGGGGENRVAKLRPDASPRERALAEGLDLLDAKKFEQASVRLNEVVDAGTWDQATKEATVGMGRILVMTGNVDEGLRAYGEVIKRDPNFMPAWHYNGMAMIMNGSPAEAVKSWEKIVEKDPAYAAKFNLQQRIEAAKRMAR